MYIKRLTSYGFKNIYFENDNGFWFTRESGKAFPFFQKNQGRIIKNVSQLFLISAVSLLVFVLKEYEICAYNCLKCETLDIATWDAGDGFICVEGLKKGISKATSILWLLHQQIIEPNFLFWGNLHYRKFKK